MLEIKPSGKNWQSDHRKVMMECTASQCVQQCVQQCVHQGETGGGGSTAENHN